MRRAPILVMAAALALAFGGSGCKQLQSRDNLNKGVQAFKSAQYPQAVEFFKTAVELDPTFLTARLYLATAYMQQYIPEAESPENKQMWTAAHDNFMKVLDQDPKNTVAIAYLASLYLNEKDWSNARQWYEKQVAVEPNNPVGYYSLAFIAWSEWYPKYGEARVNLGMKPDDPGPIKDKKVKADLKERFGPLIQSGIDNLDKALKLDPEYDDAMAYENLLYRERADLADAKAEYEAQIKIADEWMDKALATKKIKLERKTKKSQAGGITTETPQ
ncbi:MAG: tetratricopeptide repeat protein [Bryobacteraceae bacterium]|jgi:Tfp pilus assembly protein PilF